MVLVMLSISPARATNPLIWHDAAVICCDTSAIAPVTWLTKRSPSTASDVERSELVWVIRALLEIWSIVTDICSTAAAVSVVASDVC